MIFHGNIFQNDVYMFDIEQATIHYWIQQLTHWGRVTHYDDGSMLC